MSFTSEKGEIPIFYQFQHPGAGDYFCKEYGENFSFPPHMHLSFEFITVRQGTMKVTVDGTGYLLKEGDALLIFPNQLHALESTESRHMLCIFAPDLIRAYRSKAERYLPQSSLFRPDPLWIEALDRLEPDAKSIAKKGILYSLCAAFDETAVYLPRKAEQKDLLSRIFAFVEAHYGEDCSLEQLAATLGYDYAYLSRYFKKATGISYGSYLNVYRLNKTCVLLDNTDQSILQCALDCGYNSLRTFNRNFKEQFGKTPAQYRREGMQ